MGRNTDLLGFANDLYDSALIKMIRKGHSLPSTPFLQRGSQNESLRFTIVRCSFRADRKAMLLANFLGAQFLGCK